MPEIVLVLFKTQCKLGQILSCSTNSAIMEVPHSNIAYVCY